MVRRTALPASPQTPRLDQQLSPVAGTWRQSLASPHSRDARLNIFEFAMQRRCNGEAWSVPCRVKCNQNLVYVIEELTGASGQLTGQRTVPAGLGKFACLGKDLCANVRFARQVRGRIAISTGLAPSDRLRQREVHSDKTIVVSGRKSILRHAPARPRAHAPTRPRAHAPTRRGAGVAPASEVHPLGLPGKPSGVGPGNRSGLRPALGMHLEPRPDLAGGMFQFEDELPAAIGVRAQRPGGAFAVATDRRLTGRPKCSERARTARCHAAAARALRTALRY